MPESAVAETTEKVETREERIQRLREWAARSTVGDTQKDVIWLLDEAEGRQTKRTSRRWHGLAATSKPSRFVLPDERDLPEADQTVFMLKGMVREAREQFRAMMTADAVEVNGTVGVRVNKNLEVARAACREGLMGWSNLRDPDGDEILYPGTPEAGALMLHEYVVSQVAYEIMRRSQLLPGELGN